MNYYFNGLKETVLNFVKITENKNSSKGIDNKVIKGSEVPNIAVAGASVKPADKPEGRNCKVELYVEYVKMEEYDTVIIVVLMGCNETERSRLRNNQKGSKYKETTIIIYEGQGNVTVGIREYKWVAIANLTSQSRKMKVIGLDRLLEGIPIEVQFSQERVTCKKVQGRVRVEVYIRQGDALDALAELVINLDEIYKAALRNPGGSNRRSTDSQDSTLGQQGIDVGGRNLERATSSIQNNFLSSQEVASDQTFPATNITKPFDTILLLVSNNSNRDKTFTKTDLRIPGAAGSNQQPPADERTDERAWGTNAPADVFIPNQHAAGAEGFSAISNSAFSNIVSTAGGMDKKELDWPTADRVTSVYQQSPGAGSIDDRASQQSPGAGSMDKGPGRQSPGAGSVDDRPGQQSPGAGSVDDRPGQQSPGAGSMDDRAGQQSSGAGSVDDRPGQQSPGAGSVDYRPGRQSPGAGSMDDRAGQQSPGAGSVDDRPGQQSPGAGCMDDRPGQQSPGAGSIDEGPGSCTDTNTNIDTNPKPTDTSQSDLFKMGSNQQTPDNSQSNIIRMGANQQMPGMGQSDLFRTGVNEEASGMHKIDVFKMNANQQEQRMAQMMSQGALATTSSNQETQGTRHIREVSVSREVSVDTTDAAVVINTSQEALGLTLRKLEVTNTTVDAARSTWCQQTPSVADATASNTNRCQQTLRDRSICQAAINDCSNSNERFTNQQTLTTGISSEQSVAENYQQMSTGYESGRDVFCQPVQDSNKITTTASTSATLADQWGLQYATDRNLSVPPIHVRHQPVPEPQLGRLGDSFNPFRTMSDLHQPSSTASAPMMSMHAAESEPPSINNPHSNTMSLPRIVGEEIKWEHNEGYICDLREDAS